LSARLSATTRNKDQNDFSSKFHRDQLSHWLLKALENAGRGGELDAVYETEARATGSYERLVKHLIEQKRMEDAERWAREGIEKTREKLPGIASALRGLLCDMGRRRKQWDVVAAHAAAAFFDRPGVQGFNELIAAARKANCEEPVRTAALNFLETGKSPLFHVARKGKVEAVVDAAWPLPEIDYLAPPPKTRGAALNISGPHLEVLLEMAIADKRQGDVLKWHDKMLESNQKAGWHGYAGESYADQVAAAVADSHPQRALDIYRRRLDSCLPRADFSAYESSAAYLKKMRPIYRALHRDEEWQKLVAEIRHKYGNRPRFMEVLDKLEGRTILQTQQAARGRIRQ
jgi:uncharacterized Zn finger protein